MRYELEHVIGVAGVDDDVVSRLTVDAASAAEALRSGVAGLEWPIEVSGDMAFAANPAAPNKSGRYCDCWSATPETGGQDR